jgi:hypothetical protein
MAMEKLTLPTQLVNVILQYLGNQPYAAVANLIQGIQQEAQAQAQSSVEKVDAEPVN